MDDKRSSGRSKRPAKPPDDGSWDCSVCTYKNSQEAYKCEMCDVRKGTSTRKPRINPQLVAQQVAQQFAAPLSPSPGSPQPDPIDEDSLHSLPEVAAPVPEEPITPDILAPPPPPPKTLPKKEKSIPTTKKEKPVSQQKKNTRPGRLKNIDRSSGRNLAVTVDNVTVMITDYQPKKRKIAPETSRNTVHSDASDTSSTASNDFHEERTFHHENHV